MRFEANMMEVTMLKLLARFFDNFLRDFLCKSAI